MNKALFITTTIVLVALFGTVTYYGMQALEPHTYTPPVNAPEVPIQPTPLPAPSKLTPKSPTPNALSVPNGLNPNSLAPRQVLATDEQLAYLATSTLREVNPEKLFFAPKDTRAFPYGKDNVFIIERPSALVPTSLWTINTTTKTVKRIAGPAFGLMARWSKNGRYILTMSVDKAQGTSLSFIDTKTNRATPLRLTTLPSKCFITDSTPTMYCGIPKNIPEGILLPDDYLKKKLRTDDRIMKIDFAAPKVTELWGGGAEPLDIENPTVIGTDLFFTNRTDDSVWKMGL